MKKGLQSIAKFSKSDRIGEILTEVVTYDKKDSSHKR